MRRTYGPARRAGFWMLGVILLGLAVCLVFVTLRSMVSRSTTQDVTRIRRGQEAMEIARSSLAEMSFLLQRAVNDPADRLFSVMRSPSLTSGDELPLPPLAHSRELPGSDRCTIDSGCVVETLRRIAPWAPDSVGTVRLRAVVRTEGGLRRGVEESRSFRIQGIGLPVPLSRWVVGPPPGANLTVQGVSPSSPQIVQSPVDTLMATEGGPETYDTLSSPDVWQGSLASFEVSRPTSSTALRSWLDRRLASSGRVNGIVVADNRGGTPQKLSDLVFRGKALLVLTGPCVLQDVTVEDPRQDQLSVICYDTVEASGRLNLNLLRALDPASVGQAVSCSTGRIDLTGSLIDLTGIDHQTFEGTVTPGGSTGSTTGTTAADPCQSVVLISPLRRAGVVTRG